MMIRIVCRNCVRTERKMRAYGVLTACARSEKYVRTQFLLRAHAVFALCLCVFLFRMYAAEAAYAYGV